MYVYIINFNKRNCSYYPNNTSQYVAVAEFYELPRDTLYPQNLALTSPTSGGRSVGIVRLSTKGHGVLTLND
jgi:hypothetical protein